MFPERQGRVAGVVLAAGAARRMGEDKLLLRAEGETLVRRSARRALAAGLDPVLVVVRDGARAEAELARLACRVVENPDAALGMATSLARGLGAVPAAAPAAVVLLADMPLVTADLVASVVARYRAGDALLVTCAYGDVLAPPVLYDRALFAELSDERGDRGGRDVVRRHRARAATVPCPAAALLDVDEPADLARLRERASGG